MCSKFITVRFAPGSGGKFVSTLLQFSPDVNSWDQELADIKDQTNDVTPYLNYFQRKFNNDFCNWLKNEPEVPYQMNWVSNRFSRGDHVTFDQAMTLLSSDATFQEHYNNDKKIVLILNKSCIPDWIPKSSIFINIYIDNIWAVKWVHRARFHKQFLQSGTNCFIIKQDHPDHCSEQRSKLAKQFSNPTEFCGTKIQFLKKYIVGDELTLKFQNKDSIVDHPSNLNHQQVFWNLSTLNDQIVFINELEQICRTCGITPPNRQIVSTIVNYYFSLHKPFYVDKANKLC